MNSLKISEFVGVWMIERITTAEGQAHKQSHVVAIGIDPIHLEAALNSQREKYDEAMNLNGITKLVQVDYDMDRAYKIQHEDIWVVYRELIPTFGYRTTSSFKQGFEPESFWAICK